MQRRREEFKMVREVLHDYFQINRFICAILLRRSHYCAFLECLQACKTLVNPHSKAVYCLSSHWWISYGTGAIKTLNWKCNNNNYRNKTTCLLLFALLLKFDRRCINSGDLLCFKRAVHKNTSNLVNIIQFSGLYNINVNHNTHTLHNNYIGIIIISPTGSKLVI